MKTTIFPRLLFVILASILISACQSSSDGTNSAAVPSPTADIFETMSAEEEGPIEVELEVGPGDFFLQDPGIALNELSSYTETLLVSFEGSQAGQSLQRTTTYMMLHSKDPMASQLSIAVTGEGPLGVPPFLAEVNGMAYELNEEGKCTANKLDPAADSEGALDIFQPSRLILSVFGAEAAGQETFGGLTADHYTFDQQMLIEAGVSEANGELWVASDSGVLLKYALSLTGTEEYFGEGTEGVISLDYEISAIDQTSLPPLPDACKINVPLLADASNVLDIPEWLAFDTAFSIEDASAFYQQELSALGWQMQPDQLGAIYEGGRLLEFAKDSQSLIVSISLQEDGTTRVNITRGQAEEQE